MRQIDIKNKLFGNKDYPCVIILNLLTLTIFLVLKKPEFVFGSMIDWISQHSAIPHYFRESFYETGKFIPEFAFNLGAGQNIFNFSYYGLLNPVILVSYALPMVAMPAYIVYSTIVFVFLSINLFYVWLRRNAFTIKIAFIATCLFLTSAPLIYHCHRHIMFINYMPFLIIALMGVDHFFRKKRILLLIIGIFLMIMTSYFYSVSGILVIIIYGIYQYLKHYDSYHIKTFLKEGVQFLACIITAILMSGILLLPTLATLLDGREMGTTKENTANWLSLIIPKMDYTNLMYYSYGIGFGAIAFAALVAMFFMDKRGCKFLGIAITVILSFPIVSYVLNGTLYARGKVLIPFLPLIGYMIAVFLRDLRAIRIKLKYYRIVYILWAVTVVYFINLPDTKILFAFEIYLILICVGLFIRFNRLIFVYAPALIFGIIMCIVVTIPEEFVPKSTLNEIYNEDKISLIRETLENDHKSSNDLNSLLKGIYRFDDLTNPKHACNIIYADSYYKTSMYSSVYNKRYRNLFNDIFCNPNPAFNSLTLTNSNHIFFETFMGVKYVIAKDVPVMGYEKQAEQGGYRVYENNDVFPIGYATSHLMGIEEFEQLDHMEKMPAMLQNIIVDSKLPNVHQNLLVNEYVDIPLPSGKDGYLYQIDSDTDIDINVPLSGDTSSKIYIVDILFDEAPAKEDIYVTAYGTKNMLSSLVNPYPNENYHFRFIIDGKNANGSLDMTFSGGHYNICNIEVKSIYSLFLKDARNKIMPFTVEYTNGDNILKGSINVKEDGFFTFTIPYDRNFTIYVDGKEQAYECVNTAFIGFPIDKGDHKIELIYTPALLNEGILISKIGFILLVIFYLFSIMVNRYSQKEEKHR